METKSKCKDDKEVMKELADLEVDALPKKSHGNANQKATGDDKETSQSREVVEQQAQIPLFGPADKMGERVNGCKYQD